MLPWLPTCLILAGLAISSQSPADVTHTAVQHGRVLQNPPKVSRAAVLRAMVILKIAPYLKVASKQVDAKRPYRVLVIGDGPVANAIRQQLPGKTVRKRKVAVTTMTAAEAKTKDDKKGKPADLVFFAKSVKDADIILLLAKHRRRGAPTVCERAGFAADGGCIQLFVKSNALRFEINADALKTQGIKASPQLLKLSKQGPRK